MPSALSLTGNHLGSSRTIIWYAGETSCLLTDRATALLVLGARTESYREALRKRSRELRSEVLVCEGGCVHPIGRSGAGLHVPTMSVLNVGAYVEVGCRALHGQG